jgi:iron complex transport system substrate-binding protein
VVDLVSGHRDIDTFRLAGLSVIKGPWTASAWCKAAAPICWPLLLTVVASCQGGSDSEITGASFAPAAERIIVLAPHLAELSYTAGAGDRLVGVVEFSDFPDAATTLPRVGDAFRLDYEAISALEPDLILGWQTGTPNSVLARLRDLGYRVVALDSRRLDNISANIRTIGRLAGTVSQADAAASEYAQALIRLRERYRDAKNISVFYQISVRPMLTISRHHMIGEAIEICGGSNIFSALDELTPAVSMEAVLDEAPEVIMANHYGQDNGEQPDDLSVWAGWKNVPAVERGNLYFIDADEITRPSTRILAGVASICTNLDIARSKNKPTARQRLPEQRYL